MRAAFAFHRIPSATTIENWTKLTPPAFRFALKAPQKVTHFAKLKNCADTVDYFYEVVSGLGKRLGPVLFQLPASFKKDAALLGSFAEQLPPSMRAAFAFHRIPSATTIENWTKLTPPAFRFALKAPS